MRPEMQPAAGPPSRMDSPAAAATRRRAHCSAWPPKPRPADVRPGKRNPRRRCGRCSRQPRKVATRARIRSPAKRFLSCTGSSEVRPMLSDRAWILQAVTALVLATWFTSGSAAPRDSLSTKRDPLGEECEYGITLALSGKSTAAESVFTSLLSHAPGDARALANLGNV